jgi:RNA-directed DNA polymerase
MSTNLEQIAEMSKKDPQLRFTTLAHHLTPQLLRQSFSSLNQHGAPGVDGVTMEEFKSNLDEHIDLLWQELRQGRFRAMDVRRTWIPKAPGKLRPLGIPSVRDRVVQKALHTILSAVFEPCFLDLSYGFRPGLGAHDALDRLGKLVNRSGTSTVVDADIEGFFDAVNHQWLRKFLEDRISDRTILHLVGKFLNAGVMDHGLRVRNEDGVPQGGPLSPLLANIYLHYVLDLWFDRRVRKSCDGKCFLVRYADDFVAGFAHRGDAERFLVELRQRLSEFGLKLSEAKTRLVDFGPNSPRNGQGPGPTSEPRTFDFLGFTHYMRHREKRGYRCAVKPSRKSRNRFLERLKAWLAKVRDTPLRWQSKRLSERLHGWYQYFGRRHCLPGLKHLKWHVQRLWIGILRRRSDRHRLWWSRLESMWWFRNLPDPVLR